MESVIPQNISQVAREMQQRSARAIKGTPAARKRAAKAGRYAWSKRIKEAFFAGFQAATQMTNINGGLIGVELAWEIWQRGQASKVKHQVPP